MSKELLFATSNPAKFALMKTLVGSLNIRLIGLNEYPEFVPSPESGGSIDANALAKASVAFDYTGKACFAVDTSLTILGLTDEHQPGVYVRRRDHDSRERNDEEMMRHYQSLFASLGKESEGIWHSAIAFADLQGKLSSATFSNKTLFHSKGSSIHVPGEPLNAFQYDHALGKYLSEMKVEERIVFMGARAKGFQNFLQERISYL